MCGITGIVWQSGAGRVSRKQFDAMTDLLAHRGPDGRGIHWHDAPDGSGAALGHRRLSIIDLGGGAQPMCNEDGSIWIAFNGEIYNYRELRPSLEAKGHRFRSHSDTETIIHLYEEYGDNCLEHLRGMFAIAIWDTPRRRLLLARDRLGQKPLVYAQTPNRLFFASELKSLAAIPGVCENIRPQAIDEYLTYGYIPHPHTIYQGVHKLAPAHYAIYENGRLEIQRYWNPQLQPRQDLPRLQAEERLHEVVDEAVKLRLRSDVPLGAFLSGGIDSTVIVGAMQRHNTQHVNTFTIGFPVPEFDESKFALEVAEYLGTNHQRLEMRPDSLDVLEKLVWLFDEPFADSSAIPTYYLSQMTREHVKVALTGDGGDELFAGYDRHWTVHQLGTFDGLPRMLKRAMTGIWVDWIPDGAQRSARMRLKNRLSILREPPAQRYVSWLTQFATPVRQKLYRPEFLEQIDVDESVSFVSDIIRNLPAMDAGLKAMRADLLTYLPGDLLAKVDITSMAHGLECRSPFLDHRVVECALDMPFPLLAKAGQIKPMLTGTFASYIPTHLRNRPKMGFRVPLDAWFRRDLASYTREILMAENAFCRRFFRSEAISTMLDQQASGIGNHGDRIWSLLFLETWGRRTLAG